MAADWFLPLDEVGLRCLTEANGVNVSYPHHLRIGETGLLPTLAYLTVAGCILLRMHQRGTRWSQLAAPVVGGAAEE